MAVPDIMEELRKALESEAAQAQAKLDAAETAVNAERDAAKAARADVAKLRRRLSDSDAEKAKVEKALKKAQRTIAELERQLGHRDPKPENISSAAAPVPVESPASTTTNEQPWRTYTRTDSFEFLEVQGRRKMNPDFEKYLHVRLYELAADPNSIKWGEIYDLANRFNVRLKRVSDLVGHYVPAGFEYLLDQDNNPWRRRGVAKPLDPAVRAGFEEYERVIARLEPLRRFLAIVHDPMPHTNAEVEEAIDGLAEFAEMYPELAAVGPDACLAADLAGEARALSDSIARRVDHTLAAAVAKEPMLSRVEVHYTFDTERVVDLNGPSDAAVKRAQHATADDADADAAVRPSILAPPARGLSS